MAGGGGAPAPPLLGLGLDAERPERFARHARGGARRASVWTEAELAHAAAATDPALSLCASFCAKEATYKAAGGGVRFAAVELLAPPGGGTLAVGLPAAERARLGAAGALARVGSPPGADTPDLIVVAALHGEPSPPAGVWPWDLSFETVPVPDAAARAAEPLAACFAPEEREALAGRPAHTLAGRVAAKRAIARALASAGARVEPAALVIAREPREPPRLLAGVPPGWRVLFSIAHTRTAAYAVAALGAPR